MRVEGDPGRKEEGGMQWCGDLERRDLGVWVGQVGQYGECEIAAGGVAAKSELGGTSVK